jgi:hypothetical protein
MNYRGLLGQYLYINNCFFLFLSCKELPIDKAPREKSKRITRINASLHLLAQFTISIARIRNLITVFYILWYICDLTLLQAFLHHPVRSHNSHISIDFCFLRLYVSFTSTGYMRNSSSHNMTPFYLLFESSLISIIWVTSTLVYYICSFPSSCSVFKIIVLLGKNFTLFGLDED